MKETHFIQLFSLSFSFSNCQREPDLTNVHGGYTDEMRIALISASPSPTILAVPCCFFVIVDSHPTAEFTMQSDLQARSMQRLTEALERTQLEKLCFMHNTYHCHPCHSEFSDLDLISLSGLNHLRAFNVCGVRLQTSAYKSLGSANLHTLRLYHTDYEYRLKKDLRSFFQQFPSLTSL